MRLPSLELAATRMPGFRLVAPLVLAALPLSSQSIPEDVRPLPTPSGVYTVGTTVVYIADTTRHDADFPSGRPITVQLWYPSYGDGLPVRYLVEPGLAQLMQRVQYYGMDSVTIAAWNELTTHASDALPVAGPHPLIAFSVGLGVVRAQYTSIGEELASHGYVVALVESPWQGLMLRPDGLVVSDTAGRYGDPASHADGVAAWSADISFALTQLQRASRSSAIGAIAATIDWQRVGAAGHSSGGVVAVATCERDMRVRACANLDGGLSGPDGTPMAHFVTTGVRKPTLLLRSQPLYDDTTFARRGITREQWEQRGAAGRQAIEQFVERSPGAVWRVQVAGTGHFSFSDAPFVMLSAITRFGGRIIPPARGWQVITETLRAFFDRELNGTGAGLNGIEAKWPELTVMPPQ